MAEYRRFERRARPPPSWFSSAEQARLLGMLIFLIVIVTAIFRLQGPAGLGALGALFDDPRPPAKVGKYSPTVSPSKDASGETNRLKPEVPGPGQVNPLGLVQIDECRAVDPAVLAVVEDKTADRAAESAALNHLLCVTATTPSQKLAAQAQRDVFYHNLFQHPAKYRGTAVRVTGVLRSLLPMDYDSQRNPHGFSRLYEGWLFTEDHPEHPIRLLLSLPPRDLPLSATLNDRVEFFGYFFKLSAYRARDNKYHAVPMIVGHEIRRWLPPLETAPIDSRQLAGWLVLAAAALGIAGWIWWLSRRDQAQRARIRGLSGTSLASLELPDDAPPASSEAPSAGSNP